MAYPHRGLHSRTSRGSTQRHLHFYPPERALVRLGVAHRRALCRVTPDLGREECGAAGGGGLVRSGDDIVLSHALVRRKHFPGVSRRPAGEWSVLGAFSRASARLYFPATGLEFV